MKIAPEQARTHLRQFWTACCLSESGWPAALGAYEKYWNLIQAHNVQAGLVGDLSQADFHLKHVADSLAVLGAYPHLLRGGAVLADVGSGAGLPGIILVVALPRLHLTAIESNRKKAGFIAHAAGELGLADRVQVVARRSRELGHDQRYRGKFEIVVARAVAPADKLIRDCRMLLAPGGSAIFYKTPSAVAEEMALAKRAAEKHHLQIEASPVMELPAGAGTRQFIRILAPQHNEEDQRLRTPAGSPFPPRRVPGSSAGFRPGSTRPRSAGRA